VAGAQRPSIGARSGWLAAAAAVVFFDTGRGVIGKSSTSLACPAGGDGLYSGRLSRCGPGSGATRVPLVFDGLNWTRAVWLYPELAACCRKVHQPGFDKVVLFLEDGFPEQLKESLSLKLALKTMDSGLPETSLGEADPLEIERSLACETFNYPMPVAGTVKS